MAYSPSKDPVDSLGKGEGGCRNSVNIEEGTGHRDNDKDHEDTGGGVLRSRSTVGVEGEWSSAGG